MKPNFDQALEQYIDGQLDTYTEQLIRLVRIPSISQLPEHAKDTRRVLEAVSEIAKTYGFSTTIVDTDGHPAFIATLETASDHPWITIYNHMDVQPAQEPQWETEPFEPVIRDGCIYGRGTTDDKGPALTIVHAIHFLHSQGHALPNIQLIYETEEEIGSPHFGTFLDRHAHMLKTPQSILVSDTIFEGKHPTITYQLRGLQEIEVRLHTGSKELHSGVFGGVVKNPINILIHALAQCISPTGQVLIPGFYDGIQIPEGEELAALKAVAEKFNLEQMKADSGQAQFYTEEPLEILKRLWTQPTFEIHGFNGVQTGAGIKSSLAYDVSAKITMRLIAGQEPAEMVNKLQAYLKTINPALDVIDLGGVKGCRTSIQNPFMEKAADACTYGFGQAPLFVGGGGTIGSIPEFQRVYPGTPIILLAQSLMSDGYHAPNEHFRFSQVRDGMKTMAYYLHSIANLQA